MAPYCSQCGVQIDSDASFCQECGTTVEQREVYDLANWGDRFLAYIIDAIILGILFSFVNLPRLYTRVPNWVPLLDFGSKNFFYFFYFMFMDYTYGQSVGKIALKLKVIHIKNLRINLTQAAIESFGKAFLLPIDLIIGWILYRDSSQRLFNYLSETIVVKDKPR